MVGYGSYKVTVLLMLIYRRSLNTLDMYLE
jgi:hypothetical protein